MSPEKRSYVMSCIRSTRTKPELLLGSMMHASGFRYRKYAKDLPGKPDFVFRSLRTVVFMDGDFWHGWKFATWAHKLPDFWREKIKRNRERDRKNIMELRCQGWKVIRVWEHQIKKDPDAVLARITKILTLKRHVIYKDNEVLKARSKIKTHSPDDRRNDKKQL